MKTEPEEYGFHHLELKGRDIWDGVRNFLAEIKRNSLFAGWELVRLPRLSVMPTPFGILVRDSQDGGEPTCKLKIFLYYRICRYINIMLKY